MTGFFKVDPAARQYFSSWPGRRKYVDLISLLTSKDDERYSQWLPKSETIAAATGGARVLGGRMDPGHRWIPHADKPAIRLDDYIIDSFPTGDAALKYLDALHELPATSEALCRVTVLGCRPKPSVVKIVNAMFRGSVRPEQRDASFSLTDYMHSNEANMVRRLSEPDVRTHMFDAEEFCDRVCKGKMDESVYMFNIQSKKPFFMGGWNYELGYSSTAPKLVYRYGGCMVYSSLGAWAVCTADPEYDPLAAPWHEVTVFKYHTRGTFLTSICTDEYWERCAPWRTGLELAYLALTAKHGDVLSDPMVGHNET